MAGCEEIGAIKYRERGGCVESAVSQASEDEGIIRA
jgi:hypothetical protein